MKRIKNGIQVSARSYYYLLDWNDRDGWKFMMDKFDKTKLSELNLDQYMILFTHATDVEKQWLRECV